MHTDSKGLLERHPRLGGSYYLIFKNAEGLMGQNGSFTCSTSTSHNLASEPSGSVKPPVGRSDNARNCRVSSPFRSSE